MISSRLMIRLTLGILCGAALVLIPSVFPTETPAASNGSPGPALVQRYNQTTAQPFRLAPLGLGTIDMSALSFLVIVLFIFLPSLIFSLVVRRWTAKRARDYL